MNTENQIFWQNVARINLIMLLFTLFTIIALMKLSKGKTSYSIYASSLIFSVFFSLLSVLFLLSIYPLWPDGVWVHAIFSSQLAEFIIPLMLVTALSLVVYLPILIISAIAGVIIRHQEKSKEIQKIKNKK